MKKSIIRRIIHRQATWLELFFDLVFVASINTITEELSTLHNGYAQLDQILRFIISFVPIWWIWATYTLFANRFDNKNQIYNLHAILVMGMLIILSTTLKSPLTTDFYSYISCYIIIRLALAIGYIVVYYTIEKSDYTKNTFIAILSGALISCSVFAIHDEYLRIVVIILSIFVEMSWHFILSYKSPGPLINRKHLVERIGILTIIILGQSIVSMLRGLSDIKNDLSSIFAAIASFVFTIALWRVYFGSLHFLEKAIRIKQGLIVVYSHLLFHVGLIIVASLIRHTILQDITEETFILFATVSMPLFYFSRQIAYIYAYPVSTTSFLICSLVGIIITFISLLLPTNSLAMLGISFSMVVYLLLVAKWHVPNNIAKIKDLMHDDSKFTSLNNKTSN